MLRLHKPFFLHSKGWVTMITEALIIVDAGIYLISLGIIELNLSCVWIEYHQDEGP